MSPQDNFELFAKSHLIAICVIVGVALALPLAVRFLAPSAAKPIALLIAVLLLAQEGVRMWIRVDTLGFSAHLLPLHLCTLAVYLSAWMLVTQNQRIFEVVYFWGFGGTTQALLTPDLTDGFPSLSYIMHFVGHGATIVAICYAMIVFRLRPYLGSLPRVMAITLAVAALALVVNLWLDTNFMYLMAKPTRASILDWFGPWPWYLPGLILLGLLSIMLLYLPFFVSDLINRGAPAAHR